MEKLNSMCKNCTRLGNDCQGTANQVWTGCVYRRLDSKKTMFNHYKNRLINESRSNPNGIRFNCIQYLCQFPGIDPVEMAASLQKSGFTILFDDSSISQKENAANRFKVNKAVKQMEVPA